jgi:hypothetical protein
MERAIAHLRTTGVAVPDHLLAHTSPLGWSHISLTGDYLWEQAAIAVDGFRPLNTSRSRLELAATYRGISAKHIPRYLAEFEYASIVASI